MTMGQLLTQLLYVHEMLAICPTLQCEYSCQLQEDQTALQYVSFTKFIEHITV